MDKRLRAQIDAWTDADKHNKVIDTLEKILPEQRDFETTGLLARAYINMHQYEMALNLLKTFKRKGANDPDWNFRMGYALYHLNRPEEALQYLSRADELNLFDDETIDLMRACNSLLPFRKRVQDFWKWFEDNERKLSRMLDNSEKTDSDSIVKFVKRGTNLIHEDVRFNLGGDYEFSFSVEGEGYLFFLYPYVVSQMPEKFKDKWHFYPFNQASDETFILNMYNAEIDMARVKVAVEYMKEKNTFSVRFYEKKLCSLEKSMSYSAFGVMMNMMLGEGLAYLYITNVERANAPEKGMIALPKLRSYIGKTLKANNEPIYEYPHEVNTGYRFQHHVSDEFRYDVMLGSSSIQPLVVEYYNGMADIFDSFNRFGAQAMFLSFPFKNRNDKEASKAMNFRFDLEDRLKDELLAPDGGGLLLGGAVGSGTCYIDFLVFDKQAFIDKLVVLLKDYDEYEFYLSDFYLGGSTQKLGKDGFDN